MWKKCSGKKWKNKNKKILHNNIEKNLWYH